MMYVILVKHFIRLKVILQALGQNNQWILIVMLDLRFCGGIMSVILNLIIMHKNVQRIQKISGFISRGSIGGILPFNNLARKELV